MNVKNKEVFVNDFKELKKKYPDIPKNYYPDLLHKRLSFTLSNANVAFANAIRRCCINELEMKYLNVSKFTLSEKYNIPQVIENRINQIPILQTIEDDKIFKLKVSNDTDENLDVYTASFNCKPYFNENIKICTIRPNAKLEIELNIKKGKGIDDGKFSACSIIYNILDIDTTTSTLNQHNKEFYICIETNGNIEPKEIINMFEKSLTERLNIIKNNIINKKVNIIINNEIIQYEINNASHTISNLLVQYIYQLYPTIDIVNDEYITVPDDKFYLCLIHQNPEKVIISAIDKIIDDLQKFNKMI